jgi:site-specific DNA-methyltransferase (adenine-specific)
MTSPRCIAADATRPGGYDAALQGRQADVLLTDPPYCLLTRRRKGGDLRDPRAHKKIDRDPVVRFESVRDYRFFTEAWLPLAAARLKPEAPMIIWTNLLGKEPILATAARLGWSHLRGEFIWGKRTTDKNTNEQPLRVYEVALVLSRTAAAPLRPEDPPGVWAVATGYDDEGEGATTGEHPHHKPFGALEPLLRAWSRPGDVVLDPFAGSGSIPVAAQRLARVPACMELREDWAAQVTKRLAGSASPATPQGAPASCRPEWIRPLHPPRDGNVGSPSAASD